MKVLSSGYGVLEGQRRRARGLRSKGSGSLTQWKEYTTANDGPSSAEKGIHQVRRACEL